MYKVFQTELTHPTLSTNSDASLEMFVLMSSGNFQHCCSSDVVDRVQKNTQDLFL